MYDIDKYIAQMPDEEKGFNSSVDFTLARSQAILALMKLQQARLLSRFLKDTVIGQNNNKKGYDLLQNHFTHSLYGYTSRDGRFLSFSNRVILMLRKIFEPCSWFYEAVEKLPEPIAFTENPNRTGEDLFVDDTVGKILFRSLSDNFKTYRMFADEYNLPYENVKNMLNKFKYTRGGVTIIRYKTFATESIIKSLREIIHPDYWYIFPEELSSTDKHYQFVRNWISLQQAQQELNESNPYVNSRIFRG